MAMFSAFEAAKQMAAELIIQNKLLQERLIKKQRLLDEAWYQNIFLEQRIAELKQKLAETQKPTVIRKF